MAEEVRRSYERCALELRATWQRAAAVQERSRRLCAEARLQCLACGMPGANRLTVAITALILAEHKLFS